MSLSDLETFWLLGGFGSFSGSKRKRSTSKAERMKDKLLLRKHRLWLVISCIFLILFTAFPTYQLFGIIGLLFLSIFFLRIGRDKENRFNKIIK